MTHFDIQPSICLGVLNTVEGILDEMTQARQAITDAITEADAAVKSPVIQAGLDTLHNGALLPQSDAARTRGDNSVSGVRTALSYF